MGTPLAPDAQGDLLQVVQPLDIAPHAQDELLLPHLDRAPAHLAVAALDGHADIGDREVVGAQLGRIDRHLVLLDEAADGRHFRHALDRR